MRHKYCMWVGHKEPHWNDNPNFVDLKGNSQDQEDIYALHAFFYGLEAGVVLESGAYDGFNISNSLVMEQRFSISSKFSIWLFLNSQKQ